MKTILGNYTVNKEELQKLKELWISQPIVLVCGSDGGLKNTLGSSGYIIYIEKAQEPIIKGFSAEVQDNVNGSSTRQELLAQLCVEYWLLQFGKKLGEPVSGVKIKLITDSQASIMIREGVHNVRSMKALLTPDVEIAMEIARCRHDNKYSCIEFHKVKSHISIDEAPDEFFWRINEEADALATAARDEVKAGRFQAHRPLFLEGAQAMCIINGHINTANLKDRVYDSIYESATTTFLCNRYNWMEKVFKLIDWEVHRKVLTSYHGVKKITVIKYIHGWLATKQRRHREGVYADALCELCGELEDSQHIFCCQNEAMKDSRRREFWALKTRLRKLLPEAVCLALLVGLGSISGEAVNQYGAEFVTDTQIETAFKDQEDIGWDNLAKGRVARTWALLVTTNSADTTGTQELATAVKPMIDYGLNLWSHRNNLVHGNDSGISKLESRKMQQMISKVYEEIMPSAGNDHRWLFSCAIDDRLQEPYALQVAWIDSVRRIFPDKFKALKEFLGNTAYRIGEVQYQKEKGVRSSLHMD